MSTQTVKGPPSKRQKYVRPLKRKSKEVDNIVDEKECEDVNEEDLKTDDVAISSEESSDEEEDNLDLEVKPVHIKQEGIPFHTDRLPKPPFRMLMVAQSHSGKTTCIMNLITNPKMYKSYFKNRVHIFSRNILNDPAFLCLDEKILANSWDGYLPHLLEDIYNKQKELVEEEGKTKSNAQLIILDDVISDVYSRNKPSILSTMFMMCRHVNISIILTSQQYKLIPKPIRVNCSSLICFRIHNNEEIRNIFNEHGGILSYKQFEKILNYCWQGKYDFMYCELANATPAYRFRRNFSKAKSVMDLLTTHTNK
tara:strand:- start:764 stop:1693 length:930 start_codon:yes stop_codon:yes gene_type:complete